MRRKPERTAATRGAFLEAFYYLYDRTPVEKMTIQALADRAGYNRSTFYEYFEDIYDLIGSIEQEMLSIIRKDILVRIGKLEEEKDFVSILSGIYRDNWRSMTVLFGEAYFPKFAATLKRELIPAFADRMGLPMERPETGFLLDFYLSGILAVIGRWVSAPDEMTMEEFAGLMGKIVGSMAQSGLFSIEKHT